MYQSYKYEEKNTAASISPKRTHPKPSSATKGIKTQYTNIPDLRYLRKVLKIFRE